MGRREEEEKEGTNAEFNNITVTITTSQMYFISLN